VVVDPAIERIAHIHGVGEQQRIFSGRQIGLVGASQVLEYANRTPLADVVSVVLLTDPQGRHYGVAVDRFVAEQTLVVQPLDARLGKLQDIQAGAVMEDGSPVLILDVEDLLRSIEKQVASGTLRRVDADAAARAPQRRKRILVVDDSLTVRELERKLLSNRGYDVAVAVDGMDGWNMARAQQFDLVVTDVDMPRMDGIEAAERLAKNHVAPVVLLTAFSQKDLVERASESGALAYVVKPFTPNDLLPAIEIALARYAQIITLEAEVSDLAERFETRKLVDRAKGLLNDKMGLSEPDAFRWIQKASMDRRLTMHEVAKAIIEQLAPAKK
jgi:two-component system sensor histidine kinase and response regulator WspE